MQLYTGPAQTIALTINLIAMGKSSEPATRLTNNYDLNFRVIDASSSGLLPV
jgi:hypothetical protein